MHSAKDYPRKGVNRKSNSQQLVVLDLGCEQDVKAFLDAHDDATGHGRIRAGIFALAMTEE